MSNGAALLSCRNLSCGYPGRTVLSGVSFDLNPGEVVALLGPNGSGKSTLMKTILKSIPPIDGNILVDGKTLAQFSYQELARKVAFVPQEEVPTFGFTVGSAVAMGRMPVSGGFFDSEEDVRVAREAMRMTDCLDLEDRSILELSGGERQRTWIARALAQGAPILLLDEPSSHLDVSHQLTLIQLAKELAGRGLAILAAVHDLNLAAAMASRALLLSEGTIGKDGSMSDILTDPLLEEVYQVRFTRLPSKDGVRVLPDTKL